MALLTLKHTSGGVVVVNTDTIEHAWRDRGVTTIHFKASGRTTSVEETPQEIARMAHEAKEAQ